jgi:outer membrane protein OmpA-like peptidoglycan-associated protein
MLFAAIATPRFMVAQKLSEPATPPTGMAQNTIVLTNERRINTRQLEFSPAFFEDGIVFISSQKPLAKEKVFDERIESSTMSIFLARRDANGQLEKPEAFAKSLVSTLHEGPLTFDKSANNVYFSRNNNEENGKIAKYTEGVSRLKIYTARRQGETNWGLPTELPFDENNSDACHPSISDNGDKLYFSSNRVGGYGGMDLYVCERTKSGWSKPRNLGAKINTAGNEVFPFIHPDGTLFYSSNGVARSGGLDIFYVKWDNNDLALSLPNKKGKGGIGMPVNLGAPFNSDKDDFGFILDSDMKMGYLTSNRSGGVGSDDIYSFTINQSDDLENIEELTTNNAVDTGLENDAKIDANTHTTAHTTTYSRNNTAATYSRNNTANEPRNNTADEPRNNTRITTHSRDNSNIDEYSNARAEVTYEVKTKPKQLNILVVDRQTSRPISDATTSYLNLNDLSVSEIMTDATGRQAQFVKPDGTFNLDLVAAKLQNKQTNVGGKAQIKTDKNGSYVISIAKKGYLTEQITLKRGDLREDIVVLLSHPSRKVTLREGYSFKLNHVYYSYDDATIRLDAARDLDALYLIMEKYPDMEVELSSHTDARGTPAYNLDLSQRRAESAVQYLVNKGIDSQRIKATGYGEKQLKNHCASGVFCTDSEHKINRRTEVKIIKSGSAEGQIFTDYNTLETEK